MMTDKRMLWGRDELVRFENSKYALLKVEYVYEDEHSTDPYHTINSVTIYDTVTPEEPSRPGLPRMTSFPATKEGVLLAKGTLYNWLREYSTKTLGAIDPITSFEARRVFGIGVTYHARVWDERSVCLSIWGDGSKGYIYEKELCVERCWSVERSFGTETDVVEYLIDWLKGEE